MVTLYIQMTVTHHSGCVIVAFAEI